MMDPFSALLVACLVAGYFTRNVTQDLAYKARGEDPPSYRRQQERAKRRADYMADPGPAGRFWANAWADAWASADERRARMQAKARERRRRQWAQDDQAEIDAAWDEAHRVNEELDAPAKPRCKGCGKELVEGGVRELVLSGVPVRFCVSCYDRHKAECQECPDCQDHGSSGTGSAANNGSGGPEPDPFGQPTVVHDSDIYDVHADHKNGDPAGADAVVIDMGAYKRPAAAPEPIKETDVSGETTNLSAALTYTNDMAAQAMQGAASVETSIASLTAGGVTGETLTHLAQAQEALSQAMAAFNAANQALTNHIAVKEAYDANQGAGTREFVTAD